MEAAGVEDVEDGGIGARLHGVADGQAKGVGEGEGFFGLVLERALVVDVKGSFELLA